MHPLIASFSAPLPELIVRLADAGNFEEALDMIHRFQSQNIPPVLRSRLELEEIRIRRLPGQYPFGKDEALHELQQFFPASEADLDHFEKEGFIDFRYIQGVKRYFLRFAPSMARDQRVCQYFHAPLDSEKPFLDNMILRLKEKGTLSSRITLKSEIAPRQESFREGTYYAYLPYPAACALHSGITLISGNPESISPDHSSARTAFFSKHLTAPEAFSLTYSFVSTVRYANPLDLPAPSAPLYPSEPEPSPEDLAEDGVQIVFTPFLRHLAESIADRSSTPLQKAWSCYRYVTETIRYSYMPDYLLLDHLAEYCAVNRRGDCGLQALLFIVLCRILGVPARWQSGLCISGDKPGSHDWAQFWLPGWGWLYADCSFGGSAYRSGAQKRHRFYFGNIDPARMAANRLFMADFTPDLNLFRRDPYDSQTGEMGTVNGAPLAPDAYDRNVELIRIEDLT